MASVALLAMVLSALLSQMTAAQAHSASGHAIAISNTATVTTMVWGGAYSLSEEEPAPPAHCKDGQAGHCAPASLYMESAKGRLADVGAPARFPPFGSLVPHGFVAPDIPPPKSN